MHEGCLYSLQSGLSDDRQWPVECGDVTNLPASSNVEHELLCLISRLSVTCSEVNESLSESTSIGLVADPGLLAVSPRLT